MFTIFKICMCVAMGVMVFSFFPWLIGMILWYISEYRCKNKIHYKKAEKLIESAGFLMIAALILSVIGMFFGFICLLTDQWG